MRPAEGGDVLEVDELCSFVGRKDRKVWTWTALCRRTRQVVACVVGDRSEATGRRPEAYRGGLRPTYRSVDKPSGQRAHTERWHPTARQQWARYVRKTLSFSKSLAFHEAVTQWFVPDSNLGLLPSV